MKTAIQKRLDWLKNQPTREHHQYRLGVYHPSALSQKCLRKSYQQTMNMWKPSDYILLAMDIGTLTHRMMEEMYPNQHSLPFKIPIQHESGEEIYIVGETDVTTDDMGLELKTCRTLPKEVKDEHKRQVQLYMHGLNRKEWYVMYLQKNEEHPFKLERVFKVGYSPRVVEGLINKAKQLHSYIMRHEVPPPCKSMYCEMCGLMSEK